MMQKQCLINRFIQVTFIVKSPVLVSSQSLTTQPMKIQINLTDHPFLRVGDVLLGAELWEQDGGEPQDLTNV